MHIAPHRTVAAISIVVAATLSAPRLNAQTDSGIPHLAKQGSATQLLVDNKPFLALGGELGNNTASSLENMDPLWQRLVSGDLNTVLAAVSWAQLEPEEGRFEFALVDGLIDKARDNKLHLVFLWFGSWKNGFSSYAPYWVKKDYRRFPRIQIEGGQYGSGKTIELLSAFGDATRDADAAAFRALMRHIKQVDGTRHTVLMIQVENEVGVMRDTRDRSAPADAAYNSPVPRKLTDYLEQHQTTLAPELLEVWRANGAKKSGTWAEVFGPGKPSNLEIPIQTTSLPPGEAGLDTDWRKLHWASDEFFMAWQYANYIEKIVQAGKAEYNIPMYANAWLQQPNMPWPGTYPSGGPLPQVHDIWRAGAPSLDLLAPDLYLGYFDEVSQRFTRNGNPYFIPETNTNAPNAYLAFGKYNAIGYSPFFIERAVGPDTELAATYQILSQLSPMILAHQGAETMTAVKLDPGDEPKKINLSGYTLELTYVGTNYYAIAPPPKPAATTTGTSTAPASAPAANPPRLSQEAPQPVAAILISAGPDEFYIAGSGMKIAFTPNSSGPPNVGLGDVQQGRFVDGKWTVLRQLGGDDTAQGEILSLRRNSILHVTVYRYPK